IALVFLGHNDIFQGESTAQLIADMRAHIALLRQYNPQVDIFLAQPFSGGGASYEKIRQWALAVPALAAELNTAQSRVIAVDFWNSACGSHTYDTTHPTDTGYRLMADVWFAALDPFLRNNQATVANGVYQIVARHSGLCLDAFGSTDGSSVGQWTSHGESNQRWRLTNVGENQYKIEEQRSFRALDVAGWSTQNGGAVHLWNYGGGANQKWTLTPTSSGYYKIESVHSGKALDVAEVSTSPGALVHQWIYVGGQNQEWRLQAP
ncbi:MAG: RICIN domain-containing protein, partial [Verrucomicrobiota bacterium]